MGFQTQSSFPGQAYSMASMNSTSPFSGGPLRQACPLPPVGDTPLTSQKSIYSLTLEEFQNTLGEPGKGFGSMNMEELLKNIWTSEEGQAMAAAMGTADVSGLHKQKSLQKQGSLSLRGALGRKTVDEIWNSVYQGPVTVESSQISMKQRELTFKEVTLEDFLVKAGIVPDEDLGQNGASCSFGRGVGMYRNGVSDSGDSFGTVANRRMFSSPTSVLGGNTIESQQASQFDSTQLSFQPTDSLLNQHRNGGNLHHVQLLQQPPTAGIGQTFGPSSKKQADNIGLAASPIGLGGLGPPVGGGIAASLNANTSYAGFNNQLSLVVPTYKAESPLSSDGTGTSQGSMPLSPVYNSGINAPLRKRQADGQLETVVERRQRRMIKNRESAARSRARKQAYTVELENELTDLREENEKLKQKQETAERQLKKVLAVTQEVQKQPRVLLRTRTGPW
ncbi:hypothetical protein L7F22_058964 [Adiantum nelumboides]|nr:hypothetical protein [Adiantum nelumboides]